MIDVLKNLFILFDNLSKSNFFKHFLLFVEFLCQSFQSFLLSKIWLLFIVGIDSDDIIRFLEFDCHSFDLMSWVSYNCLIVSVLSTKAKSLSILDNVLTFWAWNTLSILWTWNTLSILSIRFSWSTQHLSVWSTVYAINTVRLILRLILCIFQSIFFLLSQKKMLHVWWINLIISWTALYVFNQWTVVNLLDKIFPFFVFILFIRRYDVDC